MLPLMFIWPFCNFLNRVHLNVFATVYASVHGCQRLNMAQFQNMFLNYNLEIKLFDTISGTSVIGTSINAIDCSVTEGNPMSVHLLSQFCICLHIVYIKTLLFYCLVYIYNFRNLRQNRRNMTLCRKYFFLLLNRQIKWQQIF